jgi:outer membrane protein insertion porin family
MNNMTGSRKAFLLAMLVFFACLLAAPMEAAAQRIAVFPFDIYSERDATLLRNAIYNSMTLELGKIRTVQVIPREQYSALISGKTVDETLALAVGKQIRAEYVIIGSLTQFGNRVSLDGKIVTVATGAVTAGIFAQGTGIENTGAIAAQLARDILARVSGRQVIARIDLSGNRRIESTVIYNVLKSSKGKLYSEDDLSADIRAIYRTGYFTDVKADVTDSPDGKVITFILEERPFVNEIQIKGNEAVKADDIRGVLSVKVKQAYNPDRIKADTDKVKALYDDKGYYNAEITFATEKWRDRDINVIITIKEGDLLYVKTVQFVGNQAISEKELKKILDISEWDILTFMTDSGVFKKEKLRDNLNRVKVLYQNNGYIQAQVGEPEITHDKKWIYIKIPVSEGKQFKVGTVEITGDTLSVPRPELLDKLNIKKKDYYDREAIAKDIEYLTRIANNDGYAYAEIAPRTETKDAEQKVDISYGIKKGNLVYFNRINISGNTKTRDKVIRRQLDFTEGDLYNSDKLKNSYARLNKIRYFEEVNFDTAKGPEANLTDININVKERPTGMFSVGAGYSAQSGAMLMAQISQQNLFGRGQVLSLSGGLGTQSTSIDLSFTEPYLFDMPLWMKTDFWSLNRQYDTYNLNTKGFGVTFGYPLWPSVSGYLGYRLAFNDVKDVLPTAAQTIKDQAGESTSSGIMLALARDTTDDYIFPTSGSRNRGDINITGIIFGGTNDYVKYNYSTTWFFRVPPFGDDLVFSPRGRIGYIQSAQDKPIPIYERYYVGGINTVRGVKDIGPRDPVTGDLIGGTTMLVFNFEFIFPILKNAGMKGVVFFDAGNAWNYGYYINDLVKTAGTGIRWYSPLGPLRLEWGYVLNPYPGQAPSRWEFSMGWNM